MTWFTLFYHFRKCRNHPIVDLKDEPKINGTHELHDRTNSQHIGCNDSDWMNAIKADAKRGRQLVIENLINHPFIKKELISKQVYTKYFKHTLPVECLYFSIGDYVLFIYYH